MSSSFRAWMPYHGHASALVSPGTKVALQSPGSAAPQHSNLARWGCLLLAADCAGWRGRYRLGFGCAPVGEAGIVIATLPHSPFGWSPSHEWLASLVRKADERQQLLIVDEVYRGIDLTEDVTGQLPSACELSARAVIIGGVAKTYGLTGLRIGWVICRDPELRGG